jgi:hypothetical protein
MERAVRASEADAAEEQCDQITAMSGGIGTGKNPAVAHPALWTLESRVHRARSVP